jgi:hypothetical protein
MAPKTRLPSFSIETSHPATVRRRRLNFFIRTRLHRSSWTARAAGTTRGQGCEAAGSMFKEASRPASVKPAFSPYRTHWNPSRKKENHVF